MTARDSYPPKPDKDRRKVQATRIVEILKVHRLSGGRDVSVGEVRTIASKIGRSERTVYRHLKTLQLVYDDVGSSLLDG